MNLKRINTFDELLSFLPHLVKTHKDLDGAWEPDLTQEDFVAELTNRFRSNAYYFGDVANGELVYFVVLTKSDASNCFFWLFYMNKEYRLHTKSLLLELKEFAKNLGFTQCDFSTTRLTKSYDRWVRKFGAIPITLTYRLPL